MEFSLIYINTPYITLGQFLKLIGFIHNGAEAKMYLKQNLICVNDTHEDRRGRKLFNADKITINNQFLFQIAKR